MRWKDGTPIKMIKIGMQMLLNKKKAKKVKKVLLLRKRRKRFPVMLMLLDHDVIFHIILYSYV